MSSDAHTVSKMVTGMRKPALIAGTNKYATIHDDQTWPAESQMQKYYENDVLEVDQKEPKSFDKVTEAEKEMRMVDFEDNRHVLTAQFYKKIQDLKNEHNKTLSMLERLYVNADDRCHTAKSKNSMKKSAFITDGSGLNTDSLQQEVGNPRRRKDTEEIKNLRQEYRDMEFHPDVDVELEPKSRIEEMWNDFKMKDFIGPDIIKLNKDEEKPKRPKSAPVKKKWQAVVTVPKPFSMTIREEMKKEKSHTKSSKEVADEWKRKQDEEEQELRMKVRAQEPPAHTFLPLYDEIVERQQQRSRMNRENASVALKHVMQPFSFDEEQERKIKESKRQARERQRKEIRKIKKMTKFVANTIPSSVHDPTIDQRLKENELYREIKIKLRSEDTMRASALPPRMQAHQAMRSTLKQKEQYRYSFRPQTSTVPNFNELHRREQMEMSARKVENMNTIPEPFQLRSTERGQRRNAVKQAQEEMKQDQEDFQNSIENLNRKIKIIQTTDPIPQRMTESARLRLEKTRSQIIKAEQELNEMKRKVRQKKEKREKIAKEVIQRSSLNADDPHKGITEKVQKHKHQDRLRQREYAQQLKEMNENVSRRPFMFEKVSADAALQQKMKKCDDTLRDIDIEYQSTPLADYDDSYSDFSDDEISEAERTNEVTKKLDFD